MSKVTEKYFDSKLDAPAPPRDQDAGRNQYMHIAKWQSGGGDLRGRGVGNVVNLDSRLGHGGIG